MRLLTSSSIITFDLREPLQGLRLIGFMIFETPVTRTFYMSASFTSYGGCRSLNSNRIGQKISTLCVISPSY